MKLASKAARTASKTQKQTHCQERSMALHHRARSVRRPPSLTSEKGEVEKAGTKPFDSRDHREIPNEAKSSSVISDFVFANLINSTNGSVGRELRTRSGPAGMECRNAKTNPLRGIAEQCPEALRRTSSGSISETRKRENKPIRLEAN
jgi:hypothetical protein